MINYNAFTMTDIVPTDECWPLDAQVEDMPTPDLDEWAEDDGDESEPQDYFGPYNEENYDDNNLDCNCEKCFYDREGRMTGALAHE
jgi:hypothetical protein